MRNKEPILIFIIIITFTFIFSLREKRLIIWSKPNTYTQPKWNKGLLCPLLQVHCTCKLLITFQWLIRVKKFKKIAFAFILPAPNVFPIFISRTTLPHCQDNWRAWWKTMLSDDFGWNLKFAQKCPKFACGLHSNRKTLLCNFFPDFYSVSEKKKNKAKILKRCAAMRNKNNIQLITKENLNMYLSIAIVAQVISAVAWRSLSRMQEGVQIQPPPVNHLLKTFLFRLLMFWSFFVLFHFLPLTNCLLHTYFRSLP